jgi:hypothetical protein
MSTSDPLLGHIVIVFSSTVICTVGGAASIVVTAFCFITVHYLATTPSLRRQPSDKKPPTTKDAELHESIRDIGLPIILLFTATAYFALVMYFYLEFQSAVQAAL